MRGLGLNNFYAVYYEDYANAQNMQVPRKLLWAQKPPFLAAKTAKYGGI
jgi:hypothetical protein